MKKLLKFILMPMLVATPAMSVVACSSAYSGYTADELLNIAVGRFSTGTFKMHGNASDPNDVNRLGLDKLPANGSAYSDLTNDNKNVITQYFQKFVTTGSGSQAGDWEYPSIDLTISGIDTSTFITRYNGQVQSKINVNANFSYGGLKKQSTITLIIMNDLTNNQQKAEAIATEVKTKLSSSQPEVNLDTLPPDGITGKSDVAATSALQKIGSSLRQAWINPAPTSTKANDFLIDVIGTLDIQASYVNDSAKFYELDTQSSGTVVTGQLSNLKLSITYSNQFETISGESSFNTSDLTSANQTLNVQQKADTAMQNQLRNLLNQTSITLSHDQLNPSAAPKATDTWNTYSTAFPGVTTSVQNLILKGNLAGTTTTGGIFSIYALTKMDNFLASGTWGDNILTIDGTANFEPATGDKTNSIGVFPVTLKLTYTPKGATSPVEINVPTSITTNYSHI